MALGVDPFEIDDDLTAWKEGYGGGGGRRGPGTTPTAGPLFGFGLGGGAGPGFGAGSMAAWRRRMAQQQPMTAAAGRNRYASPMGASPYRGEGGGGLGRGGGGAGSPWGRILGGGASGPATNPFGQEMGPDFLSRLLDQNAQGANGMDYAMLGQLGLAGGFNPLGSPALIEALRMQAMDSSRSNEASARTAAMMNAGNDPLMQAQAAMGTRLGGASDMNRSLMAARAQSALQNQQYLQALSQALMLGDRGLSQQIHGQRMAKDIQGSPGMGDFLGGIAGIGIGSLLGNPGIFK